MADCLYVAQNTSGATLTIAWNASGIISVVVA